MTGGSHACACKETWRDEVFSDKFDSLGADGKPARLGLFGGSFDPVHYGHLECARAAVDACDLDGAVFIPAGVSPFKPQGSSASPADRLAMCRLAVQDEPLMDVSDIEAVRSEVSYTVRTLEAIRARYPENVQLFFIVASDLIERLDRWYEAKRLAELATFVSVFRPGSPVTAKRIDELERFGFAIVDVYDEHAVDIASHTIREALAEGRDIAGLVPDDVYAYIRERRLYGPAL